MEAITKEVMKKIYSYTCQNITKSIDLMEEAGASFTKVTLKYYNPKRVLLLVGSSGNGGDALALGRYLLKMGIHVDAYLVSKNLSIDCKTNKDLFLGDFYYELPKLDYDFISDGLIGFGLNSKLKDNNIDVIEKVNHSKLPTVALDIPKVNDASSGISYGAFIKADLLITIEYPKTCLFLNERLHSYKKLEIISLGITPTNEFVHINEINDFKGVLPKRNRNTNKGSYGKALIIGGSYKYPGASMLVFSSLNKFKMGVGYSYIYVPKEVYELYALRHPEVIGSSLPSIDGHIKYDEEALKPLIIMDSIAIGMGMDISIDLYEVILYFLVNYYKTLVFDADALSTIAKYVMSPLKNKKCKVIMTPHIKEKERLSLRGTNEILNKPIDIAKEFANMYDVTIILKSASSIISDGKSISISNFGNPSLAKGGSGDTLSGILSGVLAYLDITPFESANLSCYILGRASEFASMEIEEECMSPLDISKYINKVFKEIKYE
jgi:NAD(P)H-hydrate epimerase